MYSVLELVKSLSCKNRITEYGPFSTFLVWSISLYPCPWWPWMRRMAFRLPIHKFHRYCRENSACALHSRSSTRPYCWVLYQLEFGEHQHRSKPGLLLVSNPGIVAKAPLETVSWALEIASSEEECCRRYLQYDSSRRQLSPQDMSFPRMTPMSRAFCPLYIRISSRSRYLR